MAGTWQTENKELPGAYINIFGKTPVSINLTERGIVALPIELGWGVKGQVYEVKPGDDTLKLLGANINEIVELREVLKGASKVLVCKVNEGTKATIELTSGVTATAVCEGTKGNKITVITKTVDGDHIIATYFNNSKVDEQTIKSYSDFISNGFIEIKGSGEVTQGTKQLQGGTDTSTSATNYSDALNILRTYNFNVLTYGGADSEVKSNIEAFIKDMRENEGVKIQAVMSDYSADYEGIIVVDNGVILSDGSKLTPGQTAYWVAGITAGANMNQSNTGKVYTGAIDVSPRYTKSQMEEKSKAGKVIFKVDNNQRVTLVYDINSLVTFLPDKKKSFRKNRVIRTLDNIANDVAVVWEYNYMGKIDNNVDGRSLYRAALVEYFKTLQGINAIENFKPEDVVVEAGKESDAIVVNIAIQPVDSAEKLYMTINV